MVQFFTELHETSIGLTLLGAVKCRTHLCKSVFNNEDKK